MENASKALLLAAGVLVGLILITMMIYGYGQISDYYRAKEESKESEQLADFNKEYIPYNRENVRGSDLLTLINKIIDYNEVKIDDANRGLEIEISVQIPRDATSFYYNYNENKNIKLIQLGTTYTQDNIYTELIRNANDIEATYTQALATKLSANISTLMGSNTRKEPEDLFTELKINPATYGGLKTIQEEILQYYQYQQFKRAHFNCENLTYERGQVKRFTFKFNGTFE